MACVSGTSELKEGRVNDYENPGRDIGHVERKARSEGFVKGVNVTAIVAIVVWGIAMAGLFLTGHIH